MILYNNQLQEYEFDIEVHKSHHKKDGKYAIKKYNNSILTFDIEVSSAWLQDGKVIPYHKGESNDYWNELTPVSLPYIWQFSCDGKVYYGREFRDFLKVLDDLPKVATIIWVHNLSYEFAFLSNILTWLNVFARSPHKPMKAVSKEYPHIEFRCTYMLTRLSLATWGEQLGLPKMVGDLDYDILRTPLTPLTEKELGYCERDCLVVERGIKEYVKKYGKQRNIPLTQTGTVRLEVKNRLTADENYVKKIKKLVPSSAEEYKMLQDIFAGGYTHANRFWSGHTITGTIQHYDFASSYPTVMIAEKYPMGVWTYTGFHKIPDKKTFDSYAYIFDVTFKRIKTTSFNTYIQASKVCGSNIKYDNGRVLSADELTIMMTEQDYLTIENNYVWEDIEVKRVYRSAKGYLPKPFVEYILELYKNKTELKDVEGKEELYMQSKQYINSMFGMCVTAIVQAEVRLEGDKWRIMPLTKEYVEHKFEKLRNFNPRERRYFLNFSWGCWVTAYARRNLWKCIESADHDVLYCDTDSIFVLGEKDFSWYNEEITNKLKKACEENGLDFEMTRPRTPKGKQKPLGIFDKEDNCTEFITLGAKRYCERRASDNQLHLTISGINKGAVSMLNNDINNFKDGFIFDKDDESVTKKLCTYITDMPVCKWHDGYISTYTKGINLRRTGYELGMTDEYKNLIKYADYTIDDLPEQAIIKLRSVFV